MVFFRGVRWVDGFLRSPHPAPPQCGFLAVAVASPDARREIDYPGGAIPPQTTPRCAFYGGSVAVAKKWACVGQRPSKFFTFLITF